MIMQNYAIPVSLFIGFLTGYFTRKNWFLVRQIFGKKLAQNKKIEAGGKSKKSGDDNADRGKFEPNENTSVTYSLFCLNNITF